MSQFLDCFSEEQIVSILSNIKNSMTDDTRIYILEPFTDRQIFDGAAYSLAHISLYLPVWQTAKARCTLKNECLNLLKKPV